MADERRVIFHHYALETGTSIKNTQINKPSHTLLNLICLRWAHADSEIVTVVKFVSYRQEGVVEQHGFPESITLSFCLGAEETAVSLTLLPIQSFIFFNILITEMINLRAKKIIIYWLHNPGVCVPETVTQKKIQQLRHIGFKVLHGNA